MALQRRALCNRRYNGGWGNEPSGSLPLLRLSINPQTV